MSENPAQSTARAVLRTRQVRFPAYVNGHRDGKTVILLQWAALNLFGAAHEAVLLPEG
ncbi:hypothetical protein [Mycetocola lacteus]|uniref:hypothetical protein n=1 Tax=Mycetocola lacteus TaxID=76637 RepID=UPI0016010F24|nr:hypothetical protein [Mycetocola lacteus]